MKLKIILLITALTALTITQGFAQDADKGLYIKLSAGHSVFTPGSDRLLGSTIFMYIPGNDSPGLNSNGKYGAGFYLAVGLQKDFGKLITAGLDVNYLGAKTLTATGQTLPDYSVPYKYNATGKLSFWTAVPNISFKVYSASSYHIYTKVGFIMAFNTKYATKQTFAYQTVSRTYNFDEHYKYGLNTGLQAGAGIQFKLSGRLQGFAEISNNFISVSPTSLNSVNHQEDSNHTLQVIYNHEVNFIKSNTGTLTGSSTSTTSGSVETVNSTDSWRAIYHHSNSTVLSVGVAFRIK
jgi:hypothetical protein